MDLFNASPSVLLLALVVTIATLAKTLGDLLDARADRRVTKGTTINFVASLAVAIFTGIGIGTAMTAADQFWPVIVILVGAVTTTLGGWFLWSRTPAKLKKKPANDYGLPWPGTP